MSGGARYFLTINAGSSSVKFCFFDADSLEQVHSDTAHDESSAIALINEWIENNAAISQIVALGHRVVHGGPKHDKSCLITDGVIEDLQSLMSLDSEHLPRQISLIQQLGQEFPEAMHIACFDTAFFHTLPVESRLLPIPRRYEAAGLRRYGFHGLSYTYLLSEFERVAGPEAARGKIVFAHLGNGASLAAVKDGKPIDTSMGLTPAGGIPMGTRTGDIDPGIVTVIAANQHLDADQLSRMIGFESGLLGISETTSDMKELLDIEGEDPRAKDAVDIFCYSVRKFIGSYAAAMGGINSLVFSGGIGEVSAPIRARICENLEFLGIKLDDERNNTSAECISSDGSGVGVHVIPTNETLTMARDMKAIVKGER